VTEDAPDRTVRIDLEYDGAGFEGWQRQPGARTVQQVVEDALERLLQAKTAVAAAGRTDAGVHAYRMPTSLRTRSTLPAATILRALDAILPEDVGVLAVADAPAGFHARRDARWKWYRYTWLRSRLRRVHERRTSWRVGTSLDLDAMHRGAESIRGRRDFACLQSSGSPRRSTVRTLGGLRLLEEGEFLHLDAVADGFLYGMVRALAGTLTEVGRGRFRADDLPALLLGRDRRAAGPAAPAHGLALVAVGYGGDAAPAFVDPSLGTDLESPRTWRRDSNPPTEV
jgi:tRNA pseudouridine38-40 synthase